LPTAVYHYTDANGLLGIITSGRLWATDYRYLSDSSELRYIFRLAGPAVETRLKSKEHGAIAQAFLEYVSITPPPYGETPYYICWFSEADNSLSQWRAYSKSALQRLAWVDPLGLTGPSLPRACRLRATFMKAGKAYSRDT
jgi:hypothetical protein